MSFAASHPFSLRPIAAALTVALLPMTIDTAIAAPTPNQMPGAGTIVAINSGSSGTSSGSVGAHLTNLTSGFGLGIDGKVVIRWGGAGAPMDATNPAGFNLGANATMSFGALGVGMAVLNIDASGNPSQIYGNLVAASGPLPLCALCSAAPAIFVANANGIVVGASGRIVAPAGVGLIGANMDNGTSIDEFVANNGWANPAPPALGTSYLSIGALPTAGGTPGQITIAGAINGDLGTNTAAPYVLVVGNNVEVLNTGNLFANKVLIQAGVVPTAGKASVAGVTNVTVNRLWDVDGATALVDGALGSAPGWLSLSGPAGNGNITNEGSISSPGFGGVDYVRIQASGNIRSGIEGSQDPQIGIFSGPGVFIDSMSNTSSVSIFNMLTSYSDFPELDSLFINRWATNHLDIPEVTPTYANVVLKALTPGHRPSSISTDLQVEIFGHDIVIGSTINHKLLAEGATQNTGSLLVEARGSLTMAADFGAADTVLLSAGHDMLISGNGVASILPAVDCCGFIITGGDGITTVTGNLTAVSAILLSPSIAFDLKGKAVISGKLTTASGGVSIYNTGAGPNNELIISGDVNSAAELSIVQTASPLPAPITVTGTIVADGPIMIYNDGNAAGNATTISGNLTSLSSSVTIENRGLLSGLLETSGALTAASTVSLRSDGNARLGRIEAADIQALVEGLHLEVNGPWTAGSATIDTPLATAVFTPTGTITAPVIGLRGLHFKGVDASGAAYDSESAKPSAQFVTNDFSVALSGSINAPIVGNTNWLLNSLDIAPLVTLAPVFVSVTAEGGGFQAVNLRVLGNEVFDTAGTRTPFVGVPLTSGGFPSGGMQGNLGSQLIIQADGSLTIVGTPTGSLTGPSSAAQWPGGASFIAGTTLQLQTPFYNAWSVESPPFGGSFWTAPVIALNGYIATSGTAWANFSTKPVTGDPTVYQIRKLDTAAFGFAASTAFVKNDYVETVVGGAVCSQTGPTTWTVCP